MPGSRPKMRRRGSQFDRVMTGASAGCTAFLLGVLVLGILLLGLTLRGN